MAGAFFALGFPNYTGIIFFIAPIIGVSIYLRQILLNRELIPKLIFGLIFTISIYYIGLAWTTDSFTEYSPKFSSYGFLISPFFAISAFPHILIWGFIVHLLQKLNVFKNNNSITSIVFLTSMLSLLTLSTPQPLNINLAHPWIALAPYMYLAKIFGNFIYLFVAYLLAFILSSQFHAKKKAILTLSIFSSFILLDAGLSVLMRNDKVKNSEMINIKVVQAGAERFHISPQTWKQRKYFKELEHFALSIKDLPIEDYTLLLWGENTYNYEGPLLPYLKNGAFKRKLLLPYNIELLVGTSTVDRKLNGVYNSTLLVNSKNKLLGFYHKHKLMPVGEDLTTTVIGYILSHNLPGFRAQLRGNKFTLFHTKNDFKFISPICYEITFSSLVRDYLNSVSARPDFIVNPTNEVWFDKDSLQFEQHLFSAQWRALEFNLPVVRSGSVGISAIINTDGVVEKKLGAYKRGVLDLKLFKSTMKETFFQKYGNTPLATVLSFYILFFIIRIRFSTNSN